VRGRVSPRPADAVVTVKNVFGIASSNERKRSRPGPAVSHPAVEDLVRPVLRLSRSPFSK
jgi:hypothetical protein